MRNQKIQKYQTADHHLASEIVRATYLINLSLVRVQEGVKQLTRQQLRTL